MPILPPELWLVTLDKLRNPPPLCDNFSPAFPDALDIPTLKALILTSRTFHFIAEPLLYERVHVEHNGRRTWAILDCLASRPERLLWVRYLTIVDCRSPLLQDVLSICPKLRALKGISASFVKIDAQTISAILRLPLLEVWTSMDVQIQGEARSIHVPTEQLRLRHVCLRAGRKVLAMEDETFAKLALSPSLESLRIHTESITSVTLRVLNAVGPSSFPQLRSFKGIVPSAFDEMYNFLRRCPNIASMCLYNGLMDVRPPPPPPDILPSLREFSGSRLSAELFVPGRPVERISICFPSDRKDDQALFGYLKKSSTTVKTFSLAVTFSNTMSELLFATIASAFPSLELLEIQSNSSRIEAVGRFDRYGQHSLTYQPTHSLLDHG